MGRFVLHWLVMTLSLGATAWILPGVHVESLGALLVAAVVVGFLNAVIKPVITLLTLPLTVLTLGLFYLVLNGLFFALAAGLVPGFSVDGLGWAILGAVLMGLLSSFLGTGMHAEDARNTRVTLERD